MHNESIRNLYDVREVVAGSQRPVVNLSLAINYALHKLDVRGYHAFNLAVHLLAGLTLYGIIRRTLLLPALRHRYGRGAPWFALATSLIWVVHPLQTESVTYIIQRAESMMGLFYLLIVYCLVRGVESPLRRWWFAAAAVSAAVGMGCKTIIITAPAVVVLYDRTFLAGSFREVFRLRWRVHAGVIAATVAAGLWTGEGLHVLNKITTEESGTRIIGSPIRARTPIEYWATQPAVILRYLRLSYWPSDLCLAYDWQPARSAGEIVPSAVALVVLLAVTIWALVRRPIWGFSAAWFFIILAPTSTFWKLLLAFEHRMYLPLLGVMVLSLAAGHRVLMVPLRHLHAGIRTQRFVMVAVVALVGALLGYTTVERNEVYRSPIAMWTDVLSKRPQNASTHLNLGVALANQGRLDEAITHFTSAARLAPGNSRAFNNLGLARAKQNRPDEAIMYYDKAIRFKPDYAEAWNNLGVELGLQGKHERSMECFHKAVTLDHGYADGHYNLGIAMILVGRVDEAVEQFETALTIEPDYVDAHNELGVALFQRNDIDGARQHFIEALRLSPDCLKVHLNLATMWTKTGRLQRAITEYREVLRIQPDHAAARQELKAALARQRQPDE